MNRFARRWADAQLIRRCDLLEARDIRRGQRIRYLESELARVSQALRTVRTLLQIQRDGRVDLLAEIDQLKARIKDLEEAL